MTCIALWNKRFVACATFIGVLFPTAANAEAKTFVELSQVRSITTSGHVDTEVRPDRVHVIFTISTAEKNLADAYKSNSEKARNLISLADELKIDKADVQTGQIQVQPDYAEDTRTHRLIRMVPTGFSVTRNVSFVLKNVDNTATLISSGLLHGANGIETVYYTCSDAAKYRATTRVAALKAARDKANELAEAAGGKVGKPLVITEGTEHHPPSLSGATNGTIGYQGGDAAYVSGTAGGIELGTISISSDVTVTFELE